MSSFVCDTIMYMFKGLKLEKVTGYAESGLKDKAYLFLLKEKHSNMYKIPEFANNKLD